MSSPWGALLPTSLSVGGAEYEIRSDYRAILDICTALSDPELDGQEKAYVLLDIFYPGLEGMPPDHYEEAVQECLRFISGGTDAPARQSPHLVDWEQDFTYIVAPVNRIIGEEIRAVEYLHWWTFLAAYQEIGDCTFAQIVSIRNKLNRHKRLSDQEQEWLRQNRHLVDFKRKYMDADRKRMEEWSGVPLHS